MPQIFRTCILETLIKSNADLIAVVQKDPVKKIKQNSVKLTQSNFLTFTV